MGTPESPVPIPGSSRVPVPGARRAGPTDPREQVQVTVVVRRRAPEPGSAASTEDLERVEEFADEHGISVGSVDPAARSVTLLGTAAQMSAAFGVELASYQQADSTTYRGREGEVRIPADLAGIVVAVMGLDNRQAARPHFRIAGIAQTTSGTPGMMLPHAATPGYPPQQVAKRYGFPTDVTAHGECVAIIELGGGYHRSDITTYFKEQGIARPVVGAVSVDGARNSPGGDADGEVLLDIEVVGAVAPGVRLAVYFGPNTTNGFYDAIAAAIHDRRRKPSVISISWGQAESGWTAQALDAYDALFADAAAAGITVFAAAGDDGAADNEPGRNVDFPASSPHVVGCGGTRLTDSDEVVWNDLASNNGATGGGVSTHFPLPDYQSGVRVPPNPFGNGGRGVPDVAGDADPKTGYLVRVDGRDVVIGGTSAVAPLWAGLTALANKRSGGRAGAPHARLYAHAEAFTDIVSGNNGGYAAGPGWDACTGLGSPLGDQIADVLAA